MKTNAPGIEVGSISLTASYIKHFRDNCQRLPRCLLKQIQRFVRLLCKMIVGALPR